MPASHQKDFQAILDVLKNSPEGTLLEEIERGLIRAEIALARRTLQRRLAKLLEQGTLQVEGQPKAYRYLLHPGSSTATSTPTVTAAADPKEKIEISPEAADIRRIVAGPQTKRQPVGYNYDFLNSYRPNVSAYLPLSVREQLRAAGRTPDGDLPAGTYLRQVYNRLLIDLSWNSSRLEGNTYSLLETERLIGHGESADGKAIVDAQMILNHKPAIEMLAEDAANIGFNRYTILNLHALLSDNLLPNPDASGRLRQVPVGISGTVFHPLEVPQLIDEYFDQILATATAINDPFEQAFFAMVHLPYLQPFEDVNKRVSRLAANIPLIRLNLCPLSFVDMPRQDYVDGLLGVYELNRVDLLRDVFVWAYERSCRRYAAVRHSLGEPDPFRLRHRTFLIETVGQIVRDALDKKAAIQRIRLAVEAVPEPERPRLIEVAETELQSLHEGNFARFRIRPSEFEAWRETWR